jgi:hypothetical protein
MFTVLVRMQGVLVFNLKLEGRAVLRVLERRSGYFVLHISYFMRFPVYAALTVETPFRSLDSPCGIYVALGNPPPPSTSVFRRQYLSINPALHSYFIHLPSTLCVETDSVVK